MLNSDSPHSSTITRLTPESRLKLYFETGDSGLRESIYEFCLAQAPDSYHSAILWSKPDRLPELSCTPAWTRSLKGGFFHHPDPYGLEIPESVLPSDRADRTLMLFLAGDWRRVCEVDPKGSSASLWKRTLSKDLISKVARALRRMLEAVRQLADPSVEQASATLERFLGSLFAEDICSMRQACPEIVERVLASPSGEPGVVEARRLGRGPSPFAQQLQQVLAQHKAHKHILETLGENIPNWTEELWERFSEVCQLKESPQLFSLLFPHLPHKIFEHFEPGQFLAYSDRNLDLLEKLVRDVARSKRPKRIEALVNSSLRWKITIACLFENIDHPPDDLAALLRQILESVPFDLINPLYPTRLKLNSEYRPFNFYRVNWPSLEESSNLDIPIWLREQPDHWPNALRLSRFRTPAQAIKWLDAELRQAQVSSQKKLALEQLGFLVSFMLGTKPPYVLDNGRKTLLMSGVDKLSDLAVYEEDAAVHILFSVLRVLHRDNGSGSRELMALQARVKPVKREVLKTRTPRFAEAIIGEDGRRFCKDCEKWYDLDQMDRPSQCRSCHLG